MRQFVKVFILLMITSIAGVSQNLKFKEAELILGGVNSDGEDFMPILSEGDSQLFFTRVLFEGNMGGYIGGSDIWMSKRGPQGWSQPNNEFYEWNTKENNSILGIHESGEIVYLLNTYNSKKGISFSKKINGRWSKPESIKIKGLSTLGHVGFFVSHDYQNILISMAGANSEGDQDLYVSNKGKDGKWSEPINLGPTVNTSGFEISPFLTKDKKYLFFSSNGHEGYGDADIFVCERLYDSWDVWSKPKNLGSNINSAGYDAYFSITPSNEVFFSSSRKSGLGMSDIYASKVLVNSAAQLPDSVASLIREAKALLNDKSETRSFLISFDPNSSEVSYANKLELENYMNQLPDNDYMQFSIEYLESPDADKRAVNLQKNRIKKVVTILRSGGISTLNIDVKVSNNRLGDMTDGDIEVVAKRNNNNRSD